MEWIPNPGGGGTTTESGVGTWALIDSVVLASDQASVTFSDIPDGFRRLVVCGNVRTDRASNAFDSLRVRVGAGTVDTGSNYRWIARREPASSTAEATGTSATGVLQTGVAGMCTAASADAGTFSVIEWTFEDYTSTSRYRTILGRGGAFASESPGNVYANVGVVATWKNATDAVDVISFAPELGSNLVSGSQFFLYGVRDFDPLGTIDGGTFADAGDGTVDGGSL